MLTQSRIRAGVVCLLVSCTSVAVGAPIWFDPLGQRGQPESFLDLVRAYDAFVGRADQVITFDDLKAGTQLSNQYAARFGVTFTNTALGRYASQSGVMPEDGPNAETITGYDGTYQPHGSLVYGKFDNHLKETPFTIHFAQPVAQVGAFVGMGVQGNIHDLTISIYDEQGKLLDRNTTPTWLWEQSSTKQNYEGFFAVRSSGPLIGRVEILNNASVDFANALLLDNVTFSASIPEPATLLCAACGLLLFRRRV